MRNEQQKQVEREAKLSFYLKKLIEKRMLDGDVTGYKLLDNGAVKFYYVNKPTKKPVNKALGTSLGQQLSAMKHVRVCHNVKGF